MNALCVAQPAVLLQKWRSELKVHQLQPPIYFARSHRGGAGVPIPQRAWVKSAPLCDHDNVSRLDLKPGPFAMECGRGVLPQSGPCSRPSDLLDPRQARHLAIQGSRASCGPSTPVERIWTA